VEKLEASPRRIAHDADFQKRIQVDDQHQRRATPSTWPRTIKACASATASTRAPVVSRWRGGLIELGVRFGDGKTRSWTVFDETTWDIHGQQAVHFDPGRKEIVRADVRPGYSALIET